MDATTTPAALSIVELLYHERARYWLRAGQPLERINLDRWRAIASFPPRRTAIYVRWTANAYGTHYWSIAGFQTCAPNEDADPIDGVRPGAELLFATTGVTKVKRVLKLLDEIENDGVQLEEVSHHYYRELHALLPTRRSLPRYPIARHRAVLDSRRFERKFEQRAANAR